MTSTQLPFDFDSLPESAVDPSASESEDDDDFNGHSFNAQGTPEKGGQECDSSLRESKLKKALSIDSTLYGTISVQDHRIESKASNGNSLHVYQNVGIPRKRHNGSVRDPAAIHRRQHTTNEESNSAAATQLRVQRVERENHHSQYSSIGLEDVYEQDENCVITETDLGEIGISEKKIACVDHTKTTTLSYVKESAPFSGYTPLFQRNTHLPKKPISSELKKEDEDLVKRRNAPERSFSLFGRRMPQSREENIKEEEVVGVSVPDGHDDHGPSENNFESRDVNFEQFEQLQSPSQVLSLIQHFQSRINRTVVDSDSCLKMEVPENVASLPPPPSCGHQTSQLDASYSEAQHLRDGEIEKSHRTSRSSSFTLTCDKEAFEAIEQLDKSIDEVGLSDEEYITTKPLEMKIDYSNPETQGTTESTLHDGASTTVIKNVLHYVPSINLLCQSSLQRNGNNERPLSNVELPTSPLYEDRGHNSRKNNLNFSKTVDASVNTDFDRSEETSSDILSYSCRESSGSERGSRFAVLAEETGSRPIGYSIVGLENNNGKSSNKSENNGLDNRKSSSIESVEDVPMVPVKPRRKLGDIEASRRMSTITLDGAVVANASSSSVDSGTLSSHHQGHFVVVAIDFGTTFSGYAFCFTRDADNIHMMRKWEGGDPGVVNQKTMTTLLLTPEGEFNSFGFTARDNYHDLDSQEARRWLYFDKFKMTLHHNTNLSENTEIKAANGVSLPAIFIFSHVLRYFKEHALQELSDQSATRILNEDVRWVITVPAIWRQPAKQFMRQAAYEAGIASSEYPDQLLIALEPEAASIYCRKLRIHQLVPDNPTPRIYPRSSENISLKTSNGQLAVCDIAPGTRYMVVDCGGGTVDITVHEMADENGNLRELHKPIGGACGSVGVDTEFENLLNDIFGADFMEQFKVKRPAGFVDLMMAFEARKRNASPFKNKPLNVSLPFSFVDYYKKCKGSTVENAVKKFGKKTIQWSSQGMLRLDPGAMKQLFVRVIQDIKNHVAEVLSITRNTVRYLFLVGGFAESQILQQELRQSFDEDIKVIIPQDVSLAVLKGAVLYGLDPTVVHVRRSRLTYGVGVLNRYIRGVHPEDKRILKDGVEWCTDVFDRFVAVDQSVGLGDVVLRSYTPARVGQKSIVLHVYCSENDSPAFITDEGVRRCGSLHLDLSDVQYVSISKRREIQTRMLFGDTEVKLAALDVATGKCVRAQIDFLNH